MKKKDLSLRISKKLVLLLFMFQVAHSYGQDLSYIYGKVVDSQNGTPLAFASIVQKGKSVGLITNDDGSFKLPKYYDVANVTLVISFIGYYSEEIQVSDLDKTNLNLIKLIQKTEFLDEIVVKNTPKNLSAKQIVQLAVDNIKNNYPFQPFSYVGYYRDYQRKEDNSYVSMNEAILEVYDEGFGIADQTAGQTRVFTYSRNPDFPVDVEASRPYDYEQKTKIMDRAKLGYLSENANEFVLLRVHDAIRNYNINTFDYVNIFEKDFVQNHSFELIRPTSINEVSLYEIRVTKSLNDVYVDGRIYISKNDYKIYKLQYSAYKRKIKENGGDLYNGFQRRFVPKKKNLIINIVVEYADQEDLMFPKYISFNNPFEVLQPPKFYPMEASVERDTSSESNSFVVEMTFNKEIDLNKAYRKKNYNIKYKDKKIRVDRVVIDFNKVKIYPKEKDLALYRRTMLGGLNIASDDFSIDVKNLEDIDGHVVFEQESISYDQFREFFIQEFNVDTQKPQGSSFMIKNLPLSMNQMINTPKDMSRYWMNTPLKE